MNKGLKQLNELRQLENELLRKKSFRREIVKFDLAFEIAETIIDARIKQGLTQKELAKRMKTKQSGIARMESGRYYPHLKSLERIAKILNIKIKNPLASKEGEVQSQFYYPLTWLPNQRAAKSAVELKSNVAANQFNKI